LSQGSNRY